MEVDVIQTHEAEVNVIPTQQAEVDVIQADQVDDNFDTQSGGFEISWDPAQ